MSSIISIEGLNKAEVLAALYNRAIPKGRGILQYRPGDMSVEQADKIVEYRAGSLYFDYLFGRLMKISIAGSVMDAGTYDLHNGVGAAAAALAPLLAKENHDRSIGNFMGLKDLLKRSESMPVYDEYGNPQSGYFFDTGVNPHWNPLSDAIDKYVFDQMEKKATDQDMRVEKMLEPIKPFDTVAEADEFIADVERYLGYGR